MRRLILFRHSKAERLEPGVADGERALTARGREDAAAIGTYIARHGLTPDRVLVSPSRRTEETWALAAAALPRQPALVREPRIYDASTERLFQIVASAANDAARLMIVGHNPGLHELALVLTATGDIDARERLREKFPTSGLAVIDFAFDDWAKLHPSCGRLERFVSPRSLSDAD